MILHGAEQLRLFSSGGKLYLGIQGIEPEEVAVRLSRRGARASIAETTEVILALTGLLQHHLERGNPFRQLAERGGKVEEHPVDPGSGGGIRVLADQDEASGAGRGLAPAQGRG